MKATFDPVVESALSGWGRYPVVRSTLKRPERISSLTEIAKTSPEQSLLMRGAGRSYGDAALNAGGYTILTERLNRLLAFDDRTGLLRCEPGVSLKDIVDAFLPRGWFLPTTPGTKFVTVGGAVAFDVHGKNHHRDGAFGQFVQRLQMILASGETVSCSREENSDLFWATLGGMGLTGIITEVEFFLHRVETAYYKVRQIKAKNLDEAIALFDEYEPQYQYSVAWIDCLASKGSLGRSLLMLGNHATVGDLPAGRQAQPLYVPAKKTVRVPFDFPAIALNPYTMAAFNAVYYNRQFAREVESIVDYDSYFYPLDAIWDWNRIYGKRGFVQYQCVIPPESSQKALTQILERSSQKGRGSFLAVLKRMGEEQHQGWLSFPMSGYTLTLDIPVAPGLWEFLDDLDRVVLDFGGRIYLAKDARLSPSAFRAMYPNFPRWLQVKSQVDPDNRFRSVLSDRLQISPTCQESGS
jgi:decaprenylphospho-beta-D-ribofuranose 2-oxidase